MTPIRTCIGCRARDEQGALLRLVRRGDVVVDGTRPRLSGRGAYVHAGCLDLAVKRQAIRRAFGAAATLAEIVSSPGGSGIPPAI
ncbi:YlxR family protein [Tessaracoccus sp.]|uniref:YlxR family protein n=1 Tax=Tessaracoccus sp. TaxID=1971211 RepID=UPI0026018CF5|nr:YlxR family protein [Tessaracoccus sp.]